MKTHSTLRALGALVVAGGLVASSGCSDTTLVGQTDDTEIQDEVALPFVGLGMSREINDLIFANLDDFTHVGGLIDSNIPTNNSSFQFRNAIGQMRRDRNGEFEQTHEAVWTALKVVDIGIGVRGLEAARSNPIVAKAWLNAGFMERVMADHFCEATYQYGPTGGFNLNGFLPTWGGNERVRFTAEQVGTPLQKDSMYQRAAYEFQQAIETAEAAIANGVEPPSADPSYFDPDSTRMSGYAGLAQAHAALAQLGVDPEANWAAAVAAAAEVDTDHIEWWNTDDELRENQGHNEMWDDNEVSIWSGVHIDPAGNETQWGAALTHVLEPGDSRVELFKCLVWETNIGPEEDVFGSNFDAFDDFPNTIDGPDVQACDAGDGSFTNAGDDDAEVGGIPRWIDGRWIERRQDVAAARGTSMRLIEAEAALVDNNLPLFTQKINEIRDFYGAPPIAQPATAGALEYPNAKDDAWSLLDAEVVLETNGELRRLPYLHNWEHPFITENHTLIPMYRDMLEDLGPAHQRESCFPLASNECNLNRQLTCPDLGG